jgi:signal peptidase I
MNQAQVHAGKLNSVAAITHDSVRLAALCDLLQGGERDAWVTLEGGSMLPTIEPGSRLRLRCVREAIQIGDIVAYVAQDRLIVHRLLRIVEEPSGARRFILRGDGNRDLDDPVAMEAIVGTVLEVLSPSVGQRIRRTVGSYVIRVKRALRPLLPLRPPAAPALPRNSEERP